VATVTATVASPVGLHARAAAIFVHAVVATGLAVTIAKVGSAEPAADARSILAVLALDVRHGDVVQLSADGEGARGSLAELAGLLGGGAGPADSAGAGGSR
jgi:phosphocarrier protein HPr